jgi:DNA-binding PadR family transcriptional regulator
LTEKKMPAQGNETLVQGSKGLAQGDLRLVALALIAEAPRRGYEIIKLIEEKTADWYSPGPSIVYPMLTNLAEAGYVTASTEPPRLYTITDDGRTYLKQNRDLADVVLDRLTALGERVSRWRRALATISKPSSRIDGRLEPDADSAESLVEILARAAGNSQRK